MSGFLKRPHLRAFLSSALDRLIHPKIPLQIHLDFNGLVWGKKIFIRRGVRVRTRDITARPRLNNQFCCLFTSLFFFLNRTANAILFLGSFLVASLFFLQRRVLVDPSATCLMSANRKDQIRDSEPKDKTISLQKCI